MLWDNKKKILIGAKKARWMIDKVIKLIEEDAYCMDIANQVNASKWLLQEVNRQLLKNHLKCCAKTNLTSTDSGVVENFVDELVRARDVSTRK